MAVTRVGVGAQNTANGPTVSVLYPGGIQANDLLVAHLNSNGGYRWLAPAGWTRQVSDGYGQVFTKTAAGSESGSLSFSSVESGGASATNTRMYAYRGVIQAPVFATASGYPDPIIPPSAGVTGQLVVALGGSSAWTAITIEAGAVVVSNDQGGWSSNGYYGGSTYVAEWDPANGKMAGPSGNITSSASSWTGVTMVLVGAPDNVTITTPSDGQSFDPRLPITVEWNYADGSPQVQYEVGYRPILGGAWTDQVVSSSATSHTFAASMFTDETVYELRVRAHNGTQWGSYDTSFLDITSWTYGDEVVSSIQTGVLNGLIPGEYEVQVRTADAEDFGPWSTSASFVVTPASNTSVLINGTWVPGVKNLRVGGSWVEMPPTSVRSGGGFS